MRIQPTPLCAMRWGAECARHQARRAVERDPAYIVLWCGVNDLLDGSEFVSEDWTAVVDFLLDRSEATLVLATVPQFSQELIASYEIGPGSFFERSREQLNARIRQYAAAHAERTSLLDAAMLFSPDESLLPQYHFDGRHLNRVAHAIITAQLQDIFTPRRPAS